MNLVNDEIGYGFLVRTLGLKVSGYRLHAKVAPGVVAVRTHGNQLLVPPGVAPDEGSHLAHLEFALKHQGVELEVIQAVCPHLSSVQILSRLNVSPNGKYIRAIAALYEAFTGNELDVASSSAPYTPLFDPNDYYCGADRHQKKFRVNFNGLGDLNFCPTVRRTPELHALLDRDIFLELNDFVESVGGSENLDRALGWAYMDETRSSFAIEHEQPTEDKARKFVQLLKGAHHSIPLTQEYLTELQRNIISNIYAEAYAFRREQNWLQQGGRMRSSNITYLPPPPEQVEPLMNALMDFANNTVNIDPFIKAFVVSFGFVFIHPFMDGNGRLSRFLVHHSLCRSGKLSQGLILPVSAAMAQHESAYLDALQSVSRPIRPLWDVLIVDENEIQASFRASANPYRYWDATRCVEFGVQMAHYALDTSLIKESEFLRQYDQAFNSLNSRFDVVAKDLHALIRMAYSEGGRLSQHRRKQYVYRVESKVLDAIEQEVTQTFFADDRQDE